MLGQEIQRRPASDSTLDSSLGTGFFDKANNKKGFLSSKPCSLQWAPPFDGTMWPHSGPFQGLAESLEQIILCGCWIFGADGDDREYDIEQ